MFSEAACVTSCGKATAHHIHAYWLTFSVSALPNSSCHPHRIGCCSAVAGHLFSKVGLVPCNLGTASAPLGTKFIIPFSVYDDGSPLLKSTVNRTLLVVSPCASGKPPTSIQYVIAMVSVNSFMAKMPRYASACVGSVTTNRVPCMLQHAPSAALCK